MGNALSYRRRRDAAATNNAATYPSTHPPAAQIQSP